MTIRPANWNEQIKDVLQHFADFNFQEKAFLGKENLWSSPTELCCWPEDFLMTDWVQEHHLLMPLKLQNDFKAFFQQVEEMPENDYYINLEDAVSSPEWIKIRLLAKRILQQIEMIPELA